MRLQVYALFCGLLGSSLSLPADVLYSVTDLGTLGGSGSVGFGINNQGQVTGYSFTATGAEHAFLFSNGQMTDLGTLGGAYSNSTEVRHPPQSGWLDERQTAPRGDVSGGRNRRYLTCLSE